MQPLPLRLLAKSQRRGCTDSAGGFFEPHKDKHALTLNVLLDSGAFRGGGTAFWDEDSSSSADAPTLTVEPASGVGVVFNGAVKHAGRSVTEGVRHVLVASFSIADAAPTAGARPA